MAEPDIAVRTLVVHCPGWSLVAADLPPEVPAVVVRANRVVAATPAAAAHGVEVGLRRREAQHRCSQLEVVAHDPGRDARAFEPLAGALDAITPGVEITRPGTLAFATRGPSRYFGGDDALAERVAWIAAGALGPTAPVGVGVADGAFAALLAARRAHRTLLARADHPAGRRPPARAARTRAADARADASARAAADRPDVASLVVPVGASPTFLAPHPIEVVASAADGAAPLAADRVASVRRSAAGRSGTVDPADLVQVWRRLGLVTLGDLAVMAPGDVLGRFGPVGALAHRLASGLDARPIDARRPAPDLAVARELDPPADRVDRAAFAAKALADDLHARLAADGLACTHVLVEAETDHGEVLARRWRHEGTLTAGALAERVRWQLDGWLTGSAAVRPTAGITRLGLVPLEVVADRGRQLGFWGGESLVDERVVRAVARVQGLVGADEVTVAELRGGRDPIARVARVPVAAVDLASPRPAARPSSVVGAWPGRLPGPAPASVPAEPEPVEVVDDEGRPVGVTGRAEVTAPPARLRRRDRSVVALTGWTGPWPVEDRWWDPADRRRRARFQVVDAAGTAHLLAVEAGRWWLEATYD